MSPPSRFLYLCQANRKRVQWEGIHLKGFVLLWGCLGFLLREKSVLTLALITYDKRQRIKWSKAGPIKWISDTGLFLWHHNTHPATARHWSSAAMRVGWLVGMRCFNANISVLPSCICASPRYTELNVPDAEINDKLNCAGKSRDVSI